MYETEKAQNTTITDALINDFAENHIERLFYFCIKKTGNGEDAQDLSQDIALCVISELRRGVIPDNLSAWVWKIARNRYARYAKRKHMQNELAISIEENEIDISEDSTLEADLVLSSNLAKLRRELAFISSEYRNVVVAFYIEDKSISDIAQKLSLPLGTVKSKLFRARNILKEGMNMAREFGTRSYKPENVTFATSGSQPTGLPWKLVQRQIPKNILLEASNNPSTVEELSVALGVALPYTEEEVAILEKGTLLKKTGDKYLTGFFIFSAECQHEIYNSQTADRKKRTALLDSISDDMSAVLRKVGAVRNSMTDGDIKWWSVIYIIDLCIKEYFTKKSKSSEVNIYNPPIRANGETWGFLGYESVDLPEALAMGHNGNGSFDKAMFWAYKIAGYNMWNRAGEMGYNETLTLGSLVKNKRKLNSLTSLEKDAWNGINGKFAHDENGFAVPDILIFEGNAQKQVENFIKSHRDYAELQAFIDKAADATVEIVKKHMFDSLKDQLYYCSYMQLFNLRMMAIHDEVESGGLVVPEDVNNSTVAMYMEIF